MHLKKGHIHYRHTADRRLEWQEPFCLRKHIARRELRRFLTYWPLMLGCALAVAFALVKLPGIEKGLLKGALVGASFLATMFGLLPTQVAIGAILTLLFSSTVRLADHGIGRWNSARSFHHDYHELEAVSVKPYPNDTTITMLSFVVDDEEYDVGLPSERILREALAILRGKNVVVLNDPKTAAQVSARP